ncbi:GFA family protein [Lysobacter soyae]|jgi:hypothetical protein|uniref:GFA family protein n=1 Tax=Lysobacter soyae TaxID=2764185 RepID=A0ABX8WPH3_9GAMM|nr:GFA family protein [Lysobacter sp. CJ11]QYR52986.1 GFA family protein [Lysobacter sp. CJ11]
MSLQGSCHCGAVKFEVQGTPESVMECNCSHCQRKGFKLWFVPETEFSLLQGADALTTYQFNKHVIDHQFCKTCGCQAFGRGHAEDGTSLYAVNVRCIENEDIDSIPVNKVDGRSF